ncbi:type II/IV secretion system protein [Candidatus Peregrinibacteria bacterium]|nr:type II/IV secretion system protein [Candidatus Peregrinibacteria bacterium]
MAQGDADNRKLTKGVAEVNQQYKERDVQAKAKTLGIPYVNLLTMPINPDLADFLSKEDAVGAHAALYFQVGKKLRLAVLDPNNETTKTLLEKLRQGGFQVDISLCSEESLAAGHKIYFSEVYQKQEELRNVVEEADLGTYMKEIENLNELKAKIEAASFDKALNYIQIGAYKTHSSDIHFEPEETRVLVRFRIDGVLQAVFDITPKAYAGILTEIKYLSHLKLNILSLPQDGQYSFLVNQRQINVRVSTLPTHYGEATVMRLLDAQRAQVTFEELGFEGIALQRLMESTTLSHGMILVTGPTGSGKTTTLYSMLQRIDTRSKKVITLEDPIEYNLAGISQSQVQEDKGYTFAAGLRSILRQDPDAIMVGEIRDTETAETAVQASLTGHLVFSTLHTNSAIESIPRLLNMGVKSYVLAPALDLIVAQRLVRKLCPSCAVASPATEAERAHIDESLNALRQRGIEAPAMPAELRHPKGCPVCSQTGFKGPIAISEVLPFDQGIRDLILGNAPMPEVYAYIEKNLKMTSVHEDGILKVIHGLTTLEEVDRVAK